ncbi:sulfatase [Oceanobacillus manasiensis]|uniref:sulfatase n=1 Tax=Oceanobacillus manasiensis TaxID=586413 RepID=UPI0005AB5081|nr:sulfatase [Oceanobacillus manasiensis]
MKTVVILLDTLNRHRLNVYNQNSQLHTPNISRLAEKSVIFDNHWAGSLPCMPARRDLMTGRLDFLERGWGGIEPFDVTLPEELRKNNIFSHIVTDHYHYFSTGGENYCQAFGSWDLHRGQEGDPWVSRIKSPDLPEEYLGRVQEQYEKNRSKFKEEADYPGPRTMEAACQWLKDNEGADDYFLMVEAFDPHEPFDCPTHYLDLYNDEYDGPRFEWPKYGKVTEQPEAMAHLQKRYDGNLTMIDHWLGKLLDEMDRQELWEDTMVIFTTDHGFLLGEHNWTGKNFMHAYNEVSHLPLMVHVPGLEDGKKRISAITQNIDLMPTILDYFNLQVPSKVQGNSLLDLIKEEKEQIRDEAIYGVFGMTVNITDGKYTYLRAPVREDNHPCNVYTAIPTSFRHFHGTQSPERIEAGRFLKHTNYPVFKIPFSEEGLPFTLAMHDQESLLYNINDDYLQKYPIEDKELNREYSNRLINAMKRFNAPAEQYVRLGLVNKDKS